MTEESFLSLLYPSLFGVKYSEKDLKKIAMLKDRLSAVEIFPFLSEELQRSLLVLGWRHKWLEFLEDSHRRKIFLASIFCEFYPRAFFTLEQFPLVITYVGSPGWNEGSLISVVGSRRPKIETLKWMSSQLSEFLNASGCSVVSGGARGVDQWAHQLSLRCGLPTFALVPAGLLSIYPESLIDLGDKITSSGGALMSAYPLRQEMRKYFFHQRNQLIASLSRLCLVVQAGQKSGTLMTAAKALNLGKDVAALPFSPWDKAGSGSNQLIKDGAFPITSAQDLLTLLGFTGAELFNSIESKAKVNNP